MYQENFIDVGWAAGLTNSTQIPGLLERLDKEISEGDGAHVDGFIDDLQMFQNHRDSEEIVGLNAKLTAAEREDQIEGAQEKKELFMLNVTEN